MESLLRDIAVKPAAVPVPRRRDFKLTRGDKAQIRKQRVAKEQLDQLRDASQKHEERAMIIQERQKYDTEMGDPNIRRARFDSTNVRDGRLSNYKMAIAAMKAPVSLAGMQHMKMTHIPHATIRTAQQTMQSPPAPSSGPQTFDMAANDSEEESEGQGKGASSSSGPAPGKGKGKSKGKAKGIPFKSTLLAHATNYPKHLHPP